MNTVKEKKKGKKKSARRLNDDEWNCINTTIHYFERDKRNSVHFFAVWACSAGIVRKAPEKLKIYIGRPLAVLISDYKSYNHHEIK